jgi:hypothetical protein
MKNLKEVLSWPDMDPAGHIKLSVLDGICHHSNISLTMVMEVVLICYPIFCQLMGQK